MARVTIEDCLENLDSRFSLMHLAVRRVLQLRAGAVPLVHAPKNKEIVVALREIAASRITPDNIRQIEEARALPDANAREKEVATAQEVKEIVEAATHYEGTLEFEETEPSPDGVEGVDEDE